MFAAVCRRGRWLRVYEGTPLPQSVKAAGCCSVTWLWGLSGVLELAPTPGAVVGDDLSDHGTEGRGVSPLRRWWRRRGRVQMALGDGPRLRMERDRGGGED